MTQTKQTNMTANGGETIPVVTAARVHCGFEPDYAIQYYSPDAGDWHTWDCAYARVEADSLLTSYTKRHRGDEREWRLAKIIYV